MSGTAGSRQIGLGLLVPAATLAFAVVALVVGLLSLAPAATEPAEAAAPVTLAAPVQPLVAVRPDPALNLESDDDMVEVLHAPTAEPTLPAAIVAAVRTPGTTQPTALPTPRPTATPRDSWTGSPTFTFVALGVDRRNDREIPRTDTIMLGRVDLRIPQVTLVSIPRDLLVEIPGYGKDRINAAYVYGEQAKDTDGIGLLRRTIEKNFDIRVDHFGMLDFNCFRTAVDAVGGVTVNVPRAILDPRYPTEDYGTKIVKFEPGVQLMNGERALEYARTRSADNDFHRMQRQQLIVSAMRTQLLQLRTLPAIPSLLGGCRNMQSDLGWREYLALSTSLRSLDNASVSFAAIDEKMVVDAILPSGAAVLLPRWDVIRPMLGERFGTGTNRPGIVGSPVPLMPSASPSPVPFASPQPFASPVPFTSPVPLASPVPSPARYDTSTSS